ncbi:MAG: hypothetical protein R3B84_02460 [Zavarzinella sp.]
MNWIKSEYILKGIFLGLLLNIALKGLDWHGTGQVAIWLAGGLAVGLLLSFLRQLKELRHLARNPVGFVLYLLLENPLFIYAGIIFGLAGGALFVKPPLAEDTAYKLLGYCMLGGALLGYGLGELQTAVIGWYRFGLSIAICAAAVVGIFFGLQEADMLQDVNRTRMLGIQILLGLPFFYLLMFVATAEESEVEIAALCAMMGLGMWLARFPSNLPALGLALPIVLYMVYSVRTLNPLRVFKYTLRGYGRSQVGRVHDALMSFNRAMQLNPKNELARAGLIRLHQTVDVDRLDAPTRKLLNPNFCISEAHRLLISDQKPTEQQLESATRLLTFVAGEWPELRAQTDYYLAVAETHSKNLDSAVERLNRLLDPEQWAETDKVRARILFDAWQLALRTHPTLKQRVGDIQIQLPGRRMEALRAVFRKQAKAPNEDSLRDFRRELFHELTEEEYKQATVNGPLEDFDYDYAESQGRVLLEKSEHYDQASLLLRIAGHGKFTHGPAIFETLAATAEKLGKAQEVIRFRKMGRDCGIAVTLEQLAPEQKSVFFQQVKFLADQAFQNQEWDEAIRNYKIFAFAEQNIKDTLRNLSTAYEKKVMIIEAIRTTEDALIRGGGKDFLEKKDVYYHSVEIEDLKKRADEVRSYFDVKYCVNKARTILDSNTNDLEMLEWAEHLLKLSLVMNPKSIVAMFLLGRCLLRRGEREKGVSYLEDIREMKYSGQDERDAYELTLRQLGTLYLDEFDQVDMAIDCLRTFMDTEKSGANTLYDLGRAYEKKGDLVKAIGYYQQAANFKDHPIRWDAEEALQRLRQGSSQPN